MKNQPAKKTPHPLTKFHNNCKKLNEFSERNESLAEELEMELPILEELWEVWNEEKPVRSFKQFVETEIEGVKASSEEIDNLLKLPSEKWKEHLKKDTKRNMHRALGVVSTKDALSALRKRDRLLDVGADKSRRLAKFV